MAAVAGGGTGPGSGTGGARAATTNILAQLRHGQLSGRGLTCGAQITEALLKERDKQAKWNGIPLLLQKLYEHSHPKCLYVQKLYGTSRSAKAS